MIPQVVGAFFFATILFVYFSSRARALQRTRPLDEDRLPFPALGQASTMFSLTSLFGACFGMFLVLGVYAIAGIAGGTIVGLLLVRTLISSSAETFEGAVYERLQRLAHPSVYAGPLVGVQLAFAVSELLLLHSVFLSGLGMLPLYAILFTACVALIGYTYCLIGGYGAVYRTDIVQFVVIAVMCLALLAYMGTTVTTSTFVASLNLRLQAHHPGHWFADSIPTIFLQRCFDLAIGFLLGITFILSSPDAWKRVFIVSRQHHGKRSVALLAAAGALPFVLITPVVLAARPSVYGDLDPMFLMRDLSVNRMVFAFSILGMIACFLSAFNSAIISATHLTVLVARTRVAAQDELIRYRYIIALNFAVIIALFIATIGLGNPYALGNLLIAPYGIAGALIAGTRGATVPAPSRFIAWVWALGLLAWTLCLIPHAHILAFATTKQANTIPSAMAISFLAFCAVVIATRARRTSGLGIR
jgi:hypothetical protein